MRTGALLGAHHDAEATELIKASSSPNPQISEAELVAAIFPTHIVGMMGRSVLDAYRAASIQPPRGTGPERKGSENPAGYHLLVVS
jgi:hypothetical protein